MFIDYNYDGWTFVSHFANNGRQFSKYIMY